MFADRNNFSANANILIEYDFKFSNGLSPHHSSKGLPELVFGKVKKKPTTPYQQTTTVQYPSSEFKCASKIEMLIVFL